jgi:hypothetical protein
MVETRPDPIRPPTLNLSMEELEQMQALIDAGQLPGDFIERHFDAVDANVFGVDAPKDKQGNRLEQGRGSSRNMTQQSIDAYKRWCGPSKDQPQGEPGYAENLKKMEAQLAENLKKNPVDTREQWRRRKKAGGRR